MSKPLPPEVLELIPEGIENLVLSCTVCRLPLPSARRTVGDHAGACHKVRTLYRRLMIQQARCMACLHPSTPAERVEFRRWRKDRGDIRERGGRPKRLPASPVRLAEAESRELDAGQAPNLPTAENC